MNFKISAPFVPSNDFKKLWRHWGRKPDVQIVQGIEYIASSTAELNSALGYMLLTCWQWQCKHANVQQFQCLLWRHQKQAKTPLCFLQKEQGSPVFFYLSVNTTIFCTRLLINDTTLMQNIDGPVIETLSVTIIWKWVILSFLVR